MHNVYYRMMVKFAETCRKVHQIPDNNKRSFAVTGGSLQCTSRWRRSEDISVHYAAASVAAVSKVCVSAILLLPLPGSRIFEFMSPTDITWQSHDTRIGHWFKTAKGETDRQTDILSSQSCECTVLSLWKERGLARNNGSKRLHQSETLRPV